MVVGGVPMMLPLAVEEESFASSSASGAELEREYLAPLGLVRRDVLVTDLMPYFLANTTKSTSGRSMADNVRLFEEATGRATGIERRPRPAALVRHARELRGNVERLRSYVERCRPQVVLTLGAEAAAFVREEEHGHVEARAASLFYAAPERRRVLGIEVTVVHLVHPHLFLKKNASWMARHRAWCRGARATFAQWVRGTVPSS
jgi:uracil-DNA glycosylase